MTVYFLITYQSTKTTGHITIGITDYDPATVSGVLLDAISEHEGVPRESVLLTSVCLLPPKAESTGATT